MSKIPVLIIGFKRPESIKQVIDAVRRARPEKVYISLDGPRSGNSDDQEKQERVKKELEKIDWPCKIERNFNVNNLGSAPHIISAINWFFSQEESGIILEDDCVPDPTFFIFTEKLLEKYADNPKIMAINGSCLVGSDNTTYSYRFSKYFLSWGWATWRRAWNQFNETITDSSDMVEAASKNGLYKFTPKEITYWKKFFAGFESGRFPFWDSRWLYSIWKNNAMCITPNLNLVLNIGFTSEATHTFSRNKLIPTKTTPLTEMAHPDAININNSKDLELFKGFYYSGFVSKLYFKTQMIYHKLFKNTSV